MKLTKNDAEEVQHKMGVLRDTPDLQESYGITQEQADAILSSVPHAGGEWNYPRNPECIAAIKGELENHAVVLRHIAHDARRHLKTGQALGIDKQAKRFEEKLAGEVI